MGNQLSQLFPPAPQFTEQTVSDLKGKVYIVTGASSGVGKELTRLLYSRNGTVYLAVRNPEKAEAVIAEIKESRPDSQGVLHYLHLDLDDLEGIKASAEEFLAKEKRLDVLFNNAGKLGLFGPKGIKTKQGYEMHLGTNCVAPFLFTKLLTPLLVQTARSSPAGSVRVAWVASSSANFGAPIGGVNMQDLVDKVDKGDTHNYTVSKGGNVLYALEFRRRYKDEGVVSVALDPGNLTSYRDHVVSPLGRFVLSFLLYPVVKGAYTQLFTGLSPDVASIKQNEWVIPFGRIKVLRKDLAQAGLLEEDGGSANAKKFWEWSEEQVAQYA